MLNKDKSILSIKRLKPFWAVYNRSGQLLYRSLQKANCNDFLNRYNGEEPELIAIGNVLDVILNDNRKLGGYNGYDIGKALSEACKMLGESYLYEGDYGLLYLG